jgi:branched-chain amino acid aminotransferase
VSEAVVHCGGKLVPLAEARVSALDAGVLYGDGIYETVRAYGGKPFAIARHLARLARSAARVALRPPPREEVAQAVAETIAANGLESAVVRVTITRGPLAKRLDLSSAGAPTMIVTADPVDPAADEERRHGVRVVYSRYLRFSRHPLAGVKSTNYQVSLFARNEAREAGAAEVLLGDEGGDVVEAAAANVFCVEKDRLVTPPLARGILGGVTRDVVLEIARADGIEVVEDGIARKRLEAANEVFLTGTTIQVAPVVKVEERAIGDGRPGHLTLRLLDRYLDAVAADTGASIARTRA